MDNKDHNTIAMCHDVVLKCFVIMELHQAQCSNVATIL